jgi:hypothetical protein
MLATDRKFSVEEILSEDANRWDLRIAADLAADIESHLSEKTTTLPEVRRLLAVKGYRELRARLELEVGNTTGNDAIRAMALAMRAFAHDRPGLSAATFRTSMTDSPEWRREGQLLGAAALKVFDSAGLRGEPAIEALRMLRALVRGFVLHEMSGSFLEEVDYDRSYGLAVGVFVRGLDALRSATSPA